MGRIYSNRIYDPTDLSKTIWTKNKQYIDLTVEIDLGELTLSDEARIVWEVEDPDDPSNEDPEVNADAQKILDPNDYNSTDDDSDGTADNSDGDDNTGGRDGADKWEQIHEDYALDGKETKLKDGVSKVRFNVTDHGGDNFRIMAKFKLKAADAPSVADETGVMTVWKKILVQKGIMADVAADKQIDNDKIVDQFKIAYVEMVFDHDDAPKIDTAKLDPMGATKTLANAALHTYCAKPPTGEFIAENKGTMFLVAAHNKTPIGNAVSEVLFPKPDEVGDDAAQCKHWGFSRRYIFDSNDAVTRYAKNQ